MSKYSYKAQTKTGEIIEGEIESSDEFSLARDLKKKGSFLISAKKVVGKESNFMVTLNSFFSSVKMQDKILFIRNLGSMLGAGLSLARALSVLGRQTKNKKFKSILKTIEENISKGNELHTSMDNFRDVFSSLTIAMVKAGEKSGNMTSSLKTISEQLQQNYLLHKRVRGALIYPSIIITAMIIVGIVMLLFVVPTLTATFKELGVELPFATKMLVAISDFLKGNTILFIVGVIVFITSFVFLIRTPKGNKYKDTIFLKLPIIGNIVREVNSARTARTLSSLLVSGVDIVEALTITEEVLQNVYYKKVLSEARDRVQKGVSLSTVFSDHEDIYPILVGEMIAVGEETGKLSEMLLDIAKFYEDEVAQVTKDLSTIIEPILMVIIGVGVGFFAVSMITPLYTVLGGI